MTSVEISRGGGKRRVELHDAITVLTVGIGERDAIADAISSSLGSAVVVRAGDTPRPPTSKGATPSEPAADSDGLVAAEAAVAQAESAVRDAREALDRAERAYTAADDALLSANHAIDRDAADAMNAAEARLEVAQAAAAAARRALVQARESHAAQEAEAQAQTDEQRRQLEAARAEKDALEQQRTALIEQLGSLGPSAEPGPVEEALSGLRRLRSVKPRPSERAVGLADRWTAVQDRLWRLPAPPTPPEWLVTPALAALQEARDALARAEQSVGAAADASKVEAVEQAHREVLDAEQRVMRKGSRLNRRRLEQTQEAERAALDALRVGSYSEFLQRFAPDADAGQSGETRVERARAALADAEAVWEELHGGQASPEYTEAKAEQAEIRYAAHALLGEEVEDTDIEARLRAHLETVVDTQWASQQLHQVLVDRGIDVGDDAEAAAEAWLQSVPSLIESRRAVEEQVAAADEKIRAVDERLAALGADAFFGVDTDANASRGAPEAQGTGVSPADPFAALTAALDEATAAEREAEDALALARSRMEASEAAKVTAGELEAGATAARQAVDDAKQRLTDMEAALAAAQQATAEATDAAAAADAAAATNDGVNGANGSERIGMAGELWLLARLADARASSAAVVIDARAVAAPRALRLLERASKAAKVVVVGDETDVAEWARDLGDRAAIRSI